MTSTSIELGPNLVRVLQSLNQPLEQTAREFIVLELFRQRKISVGKAAELLTVAVADFMKLSSDAGIALFDMTGEEVQSDVATALSVGEKGSGGGRS